jgi:hypothetical protein
LSARGGQTFSQEAHCAHAAESMTGTRLSQIRYNIRETNSTTELRKGKDNGMLKSWILAGEPT